MRRIKYALNSFFKSFDGKHDYCPSCKSKFFTHIKSKEFIKFNTKLRHCNICKLLYRYPITTEIESKSFYEIEYNQPGLTTDLPSNSDLKKLLKTDFRDSEKDFSQWFPIFSSISLKLKRKIRILDYGANWGYTLYQLQKQKFSSNVFGYEYSETRRKYGEKNLGIRYISASEFNGDFDVVFSSHAIEHMYNPSLFKKHIDKILVNDGYCVLTCPNGSLSCLINNPIDWRTLWSEVHPNLISDEYLLRQFESYSGAIFPENKDEFHSFDFLSKMHSPPVSYLPSTYNLVAIFKKIHKD